MERLILEFVVTDKYTYHHLLTFPILHHSVDQALEELTSIFLMYQKEKESYHKQLKELLKKEQSIIRSIKSLQLNKQNQSFLNNPILHQIKNNLKNLSEKKQSLEQNFQKNYQYFDFGGKTFMFSNFIDYDENHQLFFVPPTIKNLNEYYQELETNIQKSSISTMKK
jgi:hypothetical protein